MPYFEFLWTEEIREHLAEHEISPQDFERVVCRPVRKGFSRSTGRPVAWGYTEDGRYIMAVYEELDGRFTKNWMMLPFCLSRPMRFRNRNHCHET